EAKSHAKQTSATRTKREPQVAGCYLSLFTNPRPSTGRDRVLAIHRCRSPQPSLIKDRKYTVGFENTFAARRDPTSPSATTNGRKTTGYVGQAARPPCQGCLAPYAWATAGRLPSR